MDENKKQEQNVGTTGGENPEDEEVKQMCDALRMDDETLDKYKNKCKDVNLASWRDTFKDLVPDSIRDINNFNIILKNLLDDNVFVIAYDEGFSKHQPMAELLSYLREPYVLISTYIFRANDCTKEFLECELLPLGQPPFVLYKNKFYKNLEELEDVLYRKIVPKPVVCEGRELKDNEYDLIVLGKTVAGLAAATEAAKFTDKVLLVDCYPGELYSVPCIIQNMQSTVKIFHDIRLGYKYGFCGTSEVNLFWEDLVKLGTDRKSKKSIFQEVVTPNRVEYVVGRPKFTDDGQLTIKSEYDDDDISVVKGTYYVIATGSGNKIPNDIIGANEHCKSIEELLETRDPPNSTLFIGDSSESIECAAILNACEFPVTVLIEQGVSTCQNYEQAFIEEIRKSLEKTGVRFIKDCKILRVSEADDERKTVEGLYEDGSTFCENFDTLVIALEKYPRSGFLGLSNVKVKVSKSRHIVTDEYERTSCPNIFAIGSVAEGRPAMDSVSEKAAFCLIHRLFGCSTRKMNYGAIPKVIAGPLEYGCIGLTEALAEDLFAVSVERLRKILIFESGENLKFEIYPHLKIKVKVLCQLTDNGEIKILGLHLLGRNVREILQGLQLLVGTSRTLSRFDKVLDCPLCPNIFENLVLKKILPSDEKPLPKITSDNLDRLIKIINTGRQGVPQEELEKTEKVKPSDLIKIENFIETEDIRRPSMKEYSIEDQNQNVLAKYRLDGIFKKDKTEDEEDSTSEETDSSSDEDSDSEDEDGEHDAEENGEGIENDGDEEDENKGDEGIEEDGENIQDADNKDETEGGENTGVNTENPGDVENPKAEDGMKETSEEPKQVTEDTEEVKQEDEKEENTA